MSLKIPLAIALLAVSGAACQEDGSPPREPLPQGMSTSTSEVAGSSGVAIPQASAPHDLEPVERFMDITDLVISVVDPGEIIPEQWSAHHFKLYVNPSDHRRVYELVSQEMSNGETMFAVEVVPLEFSIDQAREAWYRIEEALLALDMNVTGGVAPEGVLVVVNDVPAAKEIVKERGLDTLPITWEDRDDPR